LSDYTAVYRREEPINQSHTRNPRKENDTRIYPDVHLLPGKLLPVVAIHPLVGSRVNRLSRVEPLAGVAQPHTRWGSSKPRAPLEYPICELSWRRIKNPLQHLVRAPTISNCELNHLRCSKPSTASGVTRNPQQLEDQVPLECNSQVMHLNLTQSHSRCATKQRDEWRGCSLLKVCLNISNMQERTPKPDHYLFIAKG
jgi:hypothetical protein